MVFLGRICGLPPSEPVAQALLDAVRRGRTPEQGVTLDDIVVAKASTIGYLLDRIHDRRCVGHQLAGVRQSEAIVGGNAKGLHIYTSAC